MAVITAARILPVMELQPGLKDSRRPAALMYGYIVLSLLCGIRIEEIARLAGHASTRTTEVAYRRELLPVITTGAEIMDELLGRS